MTSQKNISFNWESRFETSPIEIQDHQSLDAYRVTLTTFDDERGSLSVLNGHQTFDEIRRVFFVYGSTLHSKRGDHSHHNCSQVLISSSGWTDVYLETPTHEFFCIRLSSPRFGLFIPPLHWACQYRRSNEAVLTVMASDSYSEQDYIREYQKWHSLVSNIKNPTEPLANQDTHSHSSITTNSLLELD